METEGLFDRIKKASEEQLQTALFAGLAFFVLSFPLAKYIWCYHVRANQVQAGFLLGLCVFSIFLLGLMYQKKKIPIGNIPALALIGMSVFGLISSLWTGDLTNSLYGDEFQGVGLITMVTYYALFFAGAHMKRTAYRRWLVYFMYLVLGFICLYGIMQSFHIPFMVHNVIEAAILPTRNQNYYAAFPVLFLGLVFGKLFYDEKDTDSVKGRLLWHGLACMGFAAGVASFSSLFYMGIIMQILLLLFLEFFRKKKKFMTLLLLLVEFAVVFILMDRAFDGRGSAEFFTLSEQIGQEGSLLGDSVGSGRMKIWKETLKQIVEKPLFGCGIETFIVDTGVEGSPFLYCDAHNEYLQIWAEQGTFVVVSYLIFLFALFIPGLLQFIKKDSYESDFTSRAAMFAFFGYIAQAFANIRVIQVAPYFWLCCGLLYVRKRRTDNALKNTDKSAESRTET